MKRLIFSIISLSTTLFAIFESDDTIYGSFAPYNEVGRVEGSYGFGYRVNINKPLVQYFDVSSHFCHKKHGEVTYIFPNVLMLSKVGKEGFAGFGAAFMKARRNTSEIYMIAGYPLKVLKEVKVNGPALSFGAGYNFKSFKAVKAFLQYSAYVPVEIFSDLKFSKVIFMTFSFNIGF